MTFSLKYMLSSLLGSTSPISPIRKNRARPLVELLEDRLVPTVVPGVTFTVTTFLDNNVAHPGLVSLRDAINSANTDGNPTLVDTIQFAPGLAGKTIKLAQGELQILESVNIKGLGANKLAVDGGAVGGEGGSRIFDILGGEGSPNKVSISGLTLQHGNAQGAAILTEGFGGADSVTIQTCVISANHADDRGGAIYTNGGDLTIQNTTFSKNTAGSEGGAMYSQSAHLTVQDSTFSNNTSGVEGGAFVYSPDGGLLKIQRSTFTKNTAIRKGGGALWLNDRSGIVATISGSTFNGNVAGHEGGAIGTGDDGNDTKLTIENSTISGNTAMNRDGGGIFVAGGTLTLRNDTINRNKALLGEGGGVYTRRGTSNINNTIIEGNKDKTGANDISFGESSGSATYNVQYSLIQVVPPHTINGINSHNIFGFSAGLGPLQFNGGPTMTCAITTTSKAYRAGSVQLAAGLTTDQRGPGYARVVQGFIDIGAFEIQFEVPRRHW